VFDHPWARSEAGPEPIQETHADDPDDGFMDFFTRPETAEPEVDPWSDAGPAELPLGVHAAVEIPDRWVLTSKQSRFGRLGRRRRRGGPKVKREWHLRPRRSRSHPELEPAAPEPVGAK